MKSNVDNKKIAQNALMLYGRMIIMAAIGFYTSRVVLCTLGVVDYGIYNVVGGIVGTLSVLNSAMSASTQRWITYALGKDDNNFICRVFKVCVSSQALLSIIVVGFIEIFGLYYLKNHAVIPDDRLNIAFWVFQISTATVLVNIINVPFQGVIIAHEKMGAYSMFSIVDVVMKLIICYALYFSEIDKLLLYSSLLFVTYILNVIFQQLYCRRKFAEARFSFVWDWALYKQIWSLGFWTLFGCVAFVSYSQGIVLLVNSFFGPEMNAACGVASQATNIVNQFSGNFQTAVNPQITKSYSSGNYDDLNKLIMRSCKFSAFLILLIAVPVFYESDYLLELWLGKVPDHAASFFKIGLFSVAINSVRNPLVTAALANGNIRKYQFVVNGILFTIFPIVYICYSTFSIPELSSIVYCIVMFLATLSSAYMLRSMVFLSFRLFLKRVIIRVVLVYTLSFSVSYFIYQSMNDGLIRLLLATIISLCCVCLIVLFLGMEQNERNFVFTKIQKFIK